MNFKWIFTKHQQDDNIKAPAIQDDRKPLEKRYMSMISYIEKQSRNNRSFSPQLFDFYRENSDVIVKLCIAHLQQSDPKFKIKAWSDISNNFNAIIDLSRYGHLRKIEEVQEISKVCLLDSNKLVLREIGFYLILNILSYNPMLQIPFSIYQAAVDLSQFSSDFAQFPDRQILNIASEPGWLSIIKDFSNSVMLDFSDLRKIEMHFQLTGFKREVIYLLKNLFDFTLIGNISASGLSIPDHFRRWFGVLKKSYLLLLYPDLFNESNGLGFQQCPDPIHFIVVSWISKIISTPDVFFEVFVVDSNRKLVLKILEKSLYWFNSSELAKDNALTSLKIFEGWLKNDFSSTKEINSELFKLQIFEHMIVIFNYNQDLSKERVDICRTALKLIDECYCTVKNELKITKVLLAICEILDKQKLSAGIVDMFGFSMLKILKEFCGMSYQNFDELSFYIHKWSVSMSSLINSWKNRVIEILSSQPHFQANDGCWLKYLKLPGDPFEFCQSSQTEWSSSVDEISTMLMDQGFSTAKLISLFITDTSKLILSGYETSQIICLNTLCSIFTRRGKEKPSVLQVKNLFYLLCLSIQKEYLEATVLGHYARLLDYSGMHVLLKKNLEIAKARPENVFSIVSRIICFPNCYKNAVLYNLDSSRTDYMSLKPQIFELLTSSAEFCSLKFLDCLTVFVVEEQLNSGSEYVDKGLELLLNECLNPNKDVSVRSMKNIMVLIPVLAQQKKLVLEFFVKKVMKPKKFTDEVLIVLIIDVIQCALMNIKTQISTEILKIMFQRIARLSAVAHKDSKTYMHVNIFMSYLSFYYMNFPLKGERTDIADSCFSGPLGPDEKHYSLDKHSIITISGSKFLIRNEFGKFLWECSNYQMFNSEDFTEDKNVLVETINSSKITLEISQPLPQLPENETLSLLAKFIKENIDNEINILSSNSSDPAEKVRKPAKPELKLIKNSKSSEQEPKKFTGLSRVFFANFGLETLEPLNPGDNLDRGLSLLDDIKSREQTKIGVLYVKAGQEDEKEILSNSSCSEDFVEFLKNIGNCVSLENYKGYLGGLDPKGSCGNSSVAFTSWEYDVMFHVPVLMPTDLNDAKVVKKKRHVGNDMVLVVWSEHWKDYRLDTILTHFNHCIIVVYPMQKELYRIQVLNKTNVDFGPLRNGMVVSWKILPYLVRASALNASRELKLLKYPGYERQSAIRCRKIQGIVDENTARCKILEKYQTAGY